MRKATKSRNHARSCPSYSCFRVLLTSDYAHTQKTFKSLSNHARGSLEVHLEQILGMSSGALAAYKNRIVEVYALSKTADTSCFNFYEKDSAMRFGFANANHGFGKLYFMFEAGLINPRVRWRHLIRTREGFGPTIFTQRASFLPCYSYSLDRVLGIVSWGERQFILDPENLKKMNLRSMCCIVEDSSACEISSANLVWPKSIDRVLDNLSLREMTTSWIINALLPPRIGNKWNQWEESPFVIVGDSSLEILTLHKTLASINKASLLGDAAKDYVTAQVAILDREFNVRNVACEIPTEDANRILQDEVAPVLLVKRSMFAKGGHSDSSITLYHFESPLLTKKDVPGVVLTAASIAVRAVYLNSDQGPREIDKSKVRQLVARILSKPEFSGFERSEMGMRMLESDSGLDVLVGSLGLYLCNGNFTFIHPSLVELIGLIRKSFDKEINRTTLECICRSVVDFPTSGVSRVGLRTKAQELAKSCLCIDLDYRQAQEVTSAIVTFNQSLVPISKRL